MNKPIIDKQDLIDALVLMRNSKSNEKYVRPFVEIIHALVNDFVEIPPKETTLEDEHRKITDRLVGRALYATNFSIAFYYKGDMYSSYYTLGKWSKPLILHSVTIDPNGVLNIDGKIIYD
jgi:hypothetical protein